VAAQVGTDTAEIYAISPEMLHQMIVKGDWSMLAESMWGNTPTTGSGEVWPLMQTLVREYGGAVFQTGGDGDWDVRVEGAVKEMGYLPPYGTPSYGRVASAHLLTAQHQARVVVARMKAAGWWSLDGAPPVDKGGLLNAIPGIDPDQGEHYLGDGPLDERITFIEKIDEMYRRTWNRPVTTTELQAVLEVPVWAKEGERLWPVNQWVDVAAKYMDVPQSVVLSLPEESLRDARRLWREHRNSGYHAGVSFTKDSGPPERTVESLQAFLDHIRAAFYFAQREAVEMVDAVDPDKIRLAKDQIPGGSGDSARDVDPKQLAKGIEVEMEHTDDKAVAKEIALDHLSEPGNEDYYDRLETIEKHAAGDAHKKSVALMKFLSGIAKSLGPNVGRHVYVVGGAVRDFVLDRPIKDVDVVVDSEALGNRKDAAWFAKQVGRYIPTSVSIKQNQYLVELLTVTGSWMLDGYDMKGEVIEIANTRAESYAEGGWKPESVEPADIKTDVTRRELTYNTLLLRLLDLANGPDKKDIIDLTGCGLRDLEEGVMQCPSSPDVVFSDDPSRMIRVIKFALRYGHKLTPDTKAAILRNAKKLKNVPPSHLSQMLTTIVLTDSNWKTALEMMEDLNLLDTVREILLSDKSFRAALQNHVNNGRMDMMFGLMDVGLPLGARVNFLTSAEQTRLREITLGMERDEAWDFLGKLKNTGNAVKDDKFQPGLEKQYGIVKKQKGRFYALVKSVSRELLLEDPALAHNPNRLKRLVEQGVGDGMKHTRLASLWGPTIREAAKPSLDAILDSMELPAMRRDTTKPGNVKWLLRNIQINNGEHPDLRNALEMLKALLRSQGRRAGVTGKGTSVGLFIPLPKLLAEQFPDLGDQDDSPAHVTLFYGGGVPADREEEYLDILRGVLGSVGPIKARIGDLDYFTHVEKNRRVAFVRVWFSKDMGSLRDRIRGALEDAGFEAKDSFPLAYNPHITLQYMPDLYEEYTGPVPEGDWQFDSIPVWGLPAEHHVPLSNGSSVRVACQYLGTGGLLPVMDPVYNLREIVKQLLLLEDHLFHPRKRCPDCVKKHTLMAEALAEEAVTLDLQGRYDLTGLADDVRALGQSIARDSLDVAAQNIRQLRKGMVEFIGAAALVGADG
jgi:2'-5' RNA ligase